MRDVQERIDGWERAGLIDAETAQRLRTDEAAREGDAGGKEAVPAPIPVRSASAEKPRGLAFASVFGPGVSVGEMFAYLGTGFLLGAWTAFVIRISGDSADSTLVGVGFGIVAVALTVLGITLRSGDDRRRRAAGAAFLVGTGFAASAAAAFASRWSMDGPLVAVVVGLIAVLVAGAFRRIHPALLTEFGLILSVTGFGAAVLSWIEFLITPQFDGFNGEELATFDHLPLVLAQAAGWLLIALVLGLYALVVARADEGDEAAAHRRATLVRASAGLVAVLGLTRALTKEADIGGEYQRVIPAWAADLVILALAILLVERAFRRDSGAFLFAAGAGFIAALTDFNFSYLSDSTEVGLLIEGVILLAVGFVADRLRRRLAAGESDGGAPIATARPEPAEGESATLR
ncbi:MAG TPA: hypothetical protein VFK35_06605 [Candidatus Limnocylindrales bacterium]|nr:hypothetical protein [Candidatus Limnocylindrales bacterium]